MTNFRIIWEDPDNPDDPVKITGPAPEFMGRLMAAGMTEIEAVEFVLRKDVPTRVWSLPHNRPMFAIVTADKIPTDRTNRNAWRLSHFLGEAA